MLIQETVNSVVQVAIVLAIALIAWVIFGRRAATFRRWTGLIRPTGNAMRAATVVFLAWSALTSAIYFLPEFSEATSAEGTVTGMLRSSGFSAEAVAVILVIAGIKTALSEEILFRGLVAKRLINWLGFWRGNFLQALVFGSIHLAIFLIPGGPAFSWLLAALFLLLPGGAGWLMGYVNERTGNGSIAPGWMIHALGNAISYPILAFLV